MKEKTMHLPSFIFSAALTAATGTAFVMGAVHAAPNPAAGAVLPKGTVISLRLETDLQSGRDKAGTIVLFTVNQNVYSKSHVLLLERGTLARGHVTESDGSGALGRAGKLKFTCDYALADSGTQVPLDLVVTPRADERIGEESSTLSAAVRTGGHSYPNDSAARDEYDRNRFADGVSPDYNGSGFGPDDYYGRFGAAVGVTVDPERVLGSGAAAEAERGQEYDASVAADTLLAAASSPTLSSSALSSPVISSEQLFTLKDKTQIVGILAGFDGKTYTVTTPTGRRSIPADTVQSIQAVAPVPAGKRGE
jgi:hypothetical protein